jgi:YD repeat-containing protein
VTSEAYFDAQGNPIFSSDRYHRVQLMYNDYGQVVEVRYLDGKGSPILSKEGIASIRRKYVSVNVLSEESFYGKDGEPVMVYPQRAHMVRFETDKLGREVGRAFFDEEGKPTKS